MPSVPSAFLGRVLFDAFAKIKAARPKSASRTVTASRMAPMPHGCLLRTSRTPDASASGHLSVSEYRLVASAGRTDTSTPLAAEMRGHNEPAAIGGLGQDLRSCLGRQLLVDTGRRR